MTIAYEDRVTPTEVRNAIELRILNASIDRVRSDQRRLNIFDQPSNPVLGEYVRRFVPQSETRATKPSQTTAANKHKARLADALKLGMESGSAVSTTSVLQDLYGDGYETGGTDDQDPDQSSRLSDLLTGAAGYAAALVGWMANATISPEDKADQVADEASAQGVTAADLDDIESSGGKNWIFVADDDECQQCADADGTISSLDDTDLLPPLHPGCGCSIGKVG